MVRALAAAPLRPVIDRRFALADVEDAVDYFRSGHHLGKVVLTW